MAYKILRHLLTILWLTALRHPWPCHGGTQQTTNRVIKHHLTSEHPTVAGILGDGSSDGGLLADAQEEQRYYLQQLFRLYGENDTLSFHGLTKLLLNLGLGKVQVVEIEHEDLGHGHLSHLDILDVQENKHSHSHTTLDHIQPSAKELPQKMRKNLEDESETEPETNCATSPKMSGNKPQLAVWTDEMMDPLSLTTSQGSELPTRTADPKQRLLPQDLVHAGRDLTGLDVVGKLLLLDHSAYNHLHDDCLNVTQLLLNFGLSAVSDITPLQFTLLCPALLYQIDTRVCIQHSDEIPPPRLPEKRLLLPGWGFLAITLISIPSLLAVVLVPFLSRAILHSLLAFLVALAVGTLCGDALLHLLPHAQEGHKQEKRSPELTMNDGVLKGLLVLAGIYFLFLIENLLGLMRQRRESKRQSRSKQMGFSGSEEDENVTALQVISAAEQEYQQSSDPEGDHGEVQHCSLQVNSEEEETEDFNSQTMHSTSANEHYQHPGHSHSPDTIKNVGIVGIAWMVILGDGIHNFTDGLAIGAAFSGGLSSGLGTTVAVFCHELPHELGDFAVLLQAGMPMRKVLLFSLVSALLGYLGMVVGTTVSQSSSTITSWVFAVTAGIFLYVALVDMLPEVLQRVTISNGRGQIRNFFLHSLGFLLGVGIMICIALFENQMIFTVDL
uniref:Zinc transporter ZIP5 isoform X2 n=1 Tax=Geotrypetes seraphini TaxID=260995 RepID=A0A6P8Q5C7_GEOSA|nr:zinc transporter ZIP5 isoform X2 [Geotrypetes seraphini]